MVSNSDSYGTTVIGWYVFSRLFQRMEFDESHDSTDQSSYNRTMKQEIMKLNKNITEKNED